MTPFQSQHTSIRKVGLDEKKDVFEGCILAGAVEIAMTGRLSIGIIVPSHCGLQEGGYVLQTCIPVAIVGVMVVIPTNGRVGRVLGNPISPDRNPYLDMTDMCSERRMIIEPSCTVC